MGRPQLPYQRGSSISVMKIAVLSLCKLILFSVSKKWQVLTSGQVGRKKRSSIFEITGSNNHKHEYNYIPKNLQSNFMTRRYFLAFNTLKTSGL